MKFPKLKLGDLVYIEWDDHASSDGGWTRVEEVKTFDVCMVKSCGIVIHDGEYAIKIAINLQQTNKIYCGAMTIIKSCITKIRRLI